MKLNNRYFLLRHGHAKNLLFKSRLEYIFLGRNNKEDLLTPKGIRQIEKRVEIIRSANFDLIFSSDYTRTRQTAEIVSGAIGLDVIYDRRFGEVERFEKMKDFRRRVMEGFNEVDEKYKDKKILIIGHRGVFRFLEGTLRGKSIWGIMLNYFKLGLKPGELRELKL